MPVGGRTPLSVPRAAGHPPFGYRKIAKKMGTGVRPVHNSLLRQNLQNQVANGDHQMENGNFTFLSFSDLLFFFLPLFYPFFALFCTNKGHARIFRGLP